MSAVEQKVRCKPRRLPFRYAGLINSAAQARVSGLLLKLFSRGPGWLDFSRDGQLAGFAAVPHRGQHASVAVVGGAVAIAPCQAGLLEASARACS